jgi:uncharacterized lipoprotein
MRNMTFLLILIVVLAGCSEQEKPKTYVLDAVVNQEKGQYVLTVTTDLVLSKEHYDQEHQQGEGHIHYYLNGELQGPILETTPYPLTNLKEGTNMIKLVMAGNDHSEIYQVQKELVVEANSIQP